MKRKQKIYYVKLRPLTGRHDYTLCTKDKGLALREMHTARTSGVPCLFGFRFWPKHWVKKYATGWATYYKTGSAGWET